MFACAIVCIALLHLVGASSIILEEGACGFSSVTVPFEAYLQRLKDLNVTSYPVPVAQINVTGDKNLHALLINAGTLENCTGAFEDYDMPYVWVDSWPHFLLVEEM